MTYYQWVCPDCPSWACGADSNASVEYGRRLHRMTKHDGLSFAEAARSLRSSEPSQTSTTVDVVPGA